LILKILSPILWFEWNVSLMLVYLYR